MNQIIPQKQNNIYFFGEKQKYRTIDDESQIKNLLGGKGAGLFLMSRDLEIKIPQGFIIDTNVCLNYYKNNQNFSDNFFNEIKESLIHLEKISCKKIVSESSCSETPLLLSVRSGAPVSMPGMMDTILNIGITKKNIEFMINQFGIQFAYNSYLRRLECYSDIILNLDFKNLIVEDEIFHLYHDKILRSEERFNFSKEKFEIAIKTFENMIEESGFEKILNNVDEQIFWAIKTVIKSYYGKRAKAYREANYLDESMGTAVIIQSMVFGNLNQNSGTGVVFSRDPSTGEDNIFGEFMVCAQGEDVVSGVVTPSIINDEKDKSSMKNLFPSVYDELEKTCKKLEFHFKDVQDV
jgi:pyruvate,orthophosphate dikinase